MDASAERIEYGADPDQFVVRYRPSAPSLGTAIVIHGGYWRDRYDLSSTTRICEHLAASGWTAINVEYRRAGDNPGVWPEMSSDIVAAAAIADDRPIVAIGHSAGGQLALWAGGQPHTRIAAVIALAPVADLIEADERGLSDRATRLLLGGSAAEQPEAYRSASPLHMVPLGVPQLVVHGRSDVDVPYELATAYTAAAESAGDEVTLASGDDIDHFDVIDPEHDIWREIDAVLGDWVTTLSEPDEPPPTPPSGTPH